MWGKGLPTGGWARHESIEKGIWDKWQPRSVKIIADRFMEKGMERQSHWFELTAGQMHYLFRTAIKLCCIAIENKVLFCAYFVNQAYL